MCLPSGRSSHHPPTKEEKEAELEREAEKEAEKDREKLLMDQGDDVNHGSQKVELIRKL